MDDKSKFFELLTVQVATGSSIRSAAESIGCSPSHAYHLSSTAEFKQRVSELRSEITSESVGILTQAASQASRTLLALLSSTNEPSIRLQASKAILAALGPISELAELRSRLDALERAK